jgi:hypothetical protein
MSGVARDVFEQFLWEPLNHPQNLRDLTPPTTIFFQNIHNHYEESYMTGHINSVPQWTLSLGISKKVAYQREFRICQNDESRRKHPREIMLMIYEDILLVALVVFP